MQFKYRNILQLLTDSRKKKNVGEVSQVFAGVKVQLLQLLVHHEENDVPGPHPHEGGHEAPVEGQQPLVLDGRQAAVDG